MRALERSVEDSNRDRARLAAAIAEAPVGVLLTDDAGVVLFANEAAASHLGARHGEAVAEARVRQAIETAILNRRTEHREIEIFTPQRRYLDIRAIPLEHGVESIGTVAYIIDVTEPRKVDAMRRDFIANASHELKTPLGGLAVLAETLAEQSDNPAVVGSLADRLVTEARRLSHVVGDLLDLSHAEAAERPRAPVELSEVVAAVVADVESSATARMIDLVVGTTPISSVVWGDRRQLETLFTNLLDNAIAYTSVGSEERRPRIGVHTTTSKKEVVVSIEDEGMGIGEQHLERIFERFYRADEGRGRDTGGSGLGLSIARHIARNHDGDITVESQLGVGSTFRVRLPVWRAP